MSKMIEKNAAKDDTCRFGSTSISSLQHIAYKMFLEIFLHLDRLVNFSTQ